MKIKILILLIIAAPFATKAQIGGLLNKVKSKVNQRVDNNINKAIDKSLDKTEQSIKNTEPATKATPTETLNAQPKEEKIQSYSKYDFVPGEQIIYSNDFVADAMGELPIGWNSNGTAAVVSLGQGKGNRVQLFQNTTYLTDNKEPFTENFTIEFDLMLKRDHSKLAFPQFVFGMLSSGDLLPDANELLKEYTTYFATELKLQPYDNNASHLHFETYSDSKKHLNTDIKKFGSLEQYFNKEIHVAIQVQKERLRMWFNQEKLYDLPKAVKAGVSINQLYFSVKRYGGPDQEVGYMIGNIKIAKGIPDSRHKLIDEGRFSTTGILFDVNTVVIKSESNGTLKDIADVLKKYESIKVRIVGHTDSDGSDAANLKLSSGRAEAVKNALVSQFGIDAGRLETDGKGETQPAADNRTREGRAANRRVEFIKV